MHLLTPNKIKKCDDHDHNHNHNHEQICNDEQGYRDPEDTITGEWVTSDTGSL